MSQWKIEYQVAVTLLELRGGEKGTRAPPVVWPWCSLADRARLCPYTAGRARSVEVGLESLTERTGKSCPRGGVSAT